MEMEGAMTKALKIKRDQKVRLKLQPMKPTASRGPARDRVTWGLRRNRIINT